MAASPKAKSNVLKFALFATGLSGIVAEYILSTLATYLLGNSVFQFTMIVSIMLFSMGLGSRFSKHFEQNLLQKFIFIEFALSILVSCVSLLGYLASIYYIFTGVIIYMLSVVIGLLIGMEIPLVIRINDSFESLRVNVSTMMENDYYGSLLGGVFFAFIGLPYLGLTYTPFILGSINFAVALLLLVILKNDIAGKLRARVAMLAIVVTLIIAGGALFAKPIIHFAEQRRYEDKIIYEEQSAYQRIVITQSKEDYWLFINNSQQLSTLDEHLYHDPLVHPIMRLSKNPRNVLIMGGGDGCAARDVLLYPQVKSITVVDLDPAMTRLASTHPILTELNQNAFADPKVTVVNQDGFTFLEQKASYYDVIIVDLPDPKSVDLGRLYSKEFYQLCQKHLRPQGLLITQAGSPYYATRAFRCIEKTMAKAGFGVAPLHNQVITLGEWGWILGAQHLERDSLVQSLRKLTFEDIPTRWMNNEAMLRITSFGKDIETFDTTKLQVNTLNNPVLYRYYKNGLWEDF